MKGLIATAALGAAVVFSAPVAVRAQAAQDAATVETAGDAFTRAFVDEAAFTAHFRSFWLDRTTPVPPGPAGGAAGGWLGYKSGWLYDAVQAGATLYTSLALWTPPGAERSLLFPPEHPSYAIFGEAYVSLKAGGHVFTGYRQKIDEPEVNARDIRMIPNTFEAYSVRSAFGPLGYYVAYVDRIKPVNADRFIGVAEQAGAPPGTDTGLWLGTLRYAPTENLVARLSNYFVADLLNSTYGDLAWTAPVGDGVSIQIGAQAMRQDSVGANLMPGAPFRAWSAGARTAVTFGGATLGLALTMMGDEGAYRTPYGAWAGYTSLLLKDFNRAGENALFFTAAYDFAALGAKGLSVTSWLVFGNGARDATTGRALSDNTEFDLTVDYRFTDERWPEHLRPFWIRARTAQLWERLDGAEARTYDYRLVLNYGRTFSMK
ncbi:MAG: OprD family outer membrane porin [Beijerinckiaceae bacterium]